MAALAIMLETEADFGGRMGFALAWGILNFSFIALLRRPALSGALSLTLVVLLVLLSRLKHDVVQMTANFVDLMVIDRDTAAYLFTIFPNLRWNVVGAAIVILPLMYALWWLDPFRIRSLARLLRRRLSLQIRPLGRDGGFRLRQLRLYGIGGRDRRAAEDAAGGFLSCRRPPPAHHHDP
jgi:hypothetical protein